MPPMTTLRSFIDALKSRETKTTKALTTFFTGPGHLSGSALYGDITPPSSLNQLPSSARTELLNLGLIGAEIDHVDKWPNPEKERVRQSLIMAISGNRNVRFYWELHGGSNEETEIDSAGPGDIVITFKSPQQNVRISSTVTIGDISTDVAGSRYSGP